MTTGQSLCVVCAWRKDCVKKFQKGKGVTLQCPDFTRDVSIKDTEKADVEKSDSGHH